MLPAVLPAISGNFGDITVEEIGEGFGVAGKRVARAMDVERSCCRDGRAMFPQTGALFPAHGPLVPMPNLV